MEPGFRIYEGNRTEALADRLAGRLLESEAGPFGREYVLVQSKGMEQWLRLEIARRDGVCANVRFPFPDTFVYRLFRDVAGGLPDESPYSKDALAWRLFGLLPDCLGEEIFAPLRAYAEGEASELKLFQLSERLADAYDQYLIYRPDWIAAWDRGRDLPAGSPHAPWQAELWRRVSRELESKGATHHANLHRLLVESLRTGRRPESLPSRVSVFGISSLPPFYLDILRELSRSIAVELYCVNPCREHWSYLKTPAQARKEIDFDEFSGEEWSFAVGNSLLASFGRSGREFFSLLLDQIDSGGEGSFHDPGCGSLLACIQSDILNLRERGEGLEESPLPIADGDLSLSVHSCHSRMRELEVLHDQLLKLFDEDAGLLPDDIVVMSPEVGDYAPLIEAVFGKPESEAMRIPYSIADRGLDSEGRLAGTFLSILSLAKGRFAASEVMDILANPAVMGKAGLDQKGYEDAVRLVRESGIRWGFDGKFKESLGLPAFERNTWRFGLDRMLLGHAAPCRETGERLFEGILPYDDIEGDTAKALGSLSSFVERLHETASRLREPKTLSEWSAELSSVLQDFFDPSGSNERELQDLRFAAASQGMGRCAELSGFDGKVSIDVVLPHLQGLLKSRISPHGFKSGRVTFCTLTPMRCIPFKVVCLIGMNDGDFPRESGKAGFDLMDFERRRCDWSLRHSDRYLFLEAILSARERLIVSHVGQSQRDNAPIPASPAVMELLDYVGRGFLLKGRESEGGGALVDGILFKHRLQAFSHEYFKGGRLFSFSASNCAAAQASVRPKKGAGAFVPGGFPEPPPGRGLSISVPELCRFFRNPCEHFVRNRLGARFKDGVEDSLQDEEPMELDGLASYNLKRRLLEARLKGFDPSGDGYSAVQAGGLLPDGGRGLALCRECDMKMSRLSERIKAAAGGVQDSLELDLRLPSGVSIRGTLAGIRPGGMTLHRPGKLRAADRLDAWTRHLALCAAQGGGAEPETFFFAEESSAHYKGIDAGRAMDILSSLSSLFERGLLRPLPFFPESSLEYVRKGSVAAASRKWTDSYSGRAEADDPYVAKCFREGFPDADEFESVAKEAYGPLLEAEEVEYAGD